MAGKVIIFDLDGVLFESRDMHFVALNRALMVAGHAPISAEDHKTTFNGRPSATKLSMLGIKGKDAESILVWKQTYTQHWIKRNVTLDAGLIRLFADLNEAGYVICIVSNAVSQTVETATRKLGILGSVYSLITPSASLMPKPKPDMFFHAIGIVNGTPDVTTIVEDSPVGLEAAHAVTGARVIEVSGPHETITKVREVCL